MSYITYIFYRFVYMCLSVSKVIWLKMRWKLLEATEAPWAHRRVVRAEASEDVEQWDELLRLFTEDQKNAQTRLHEEVNKEAEQPLELHLDLPSLSAVPPLEELQRQLSLLDMKTPSFAKVTESGKKPQFCVLGPKSYDPVSQKLFAFPVLDVSQKKNVLESTCQVYHKGTE